MNEKSHVTLKEAADLTGFPYPAIKDLLVFAGIKLEKQGQYWICEKNDVEATILALRLAFSHPDDAYDIIDDIKKKHEDAGEFVLEDDSRHETKRCPFCGGDDLVLRAKYIADKDMFYAFVQCKNCKASSGSSGAYVKSLISEKEAIKNWNKRPSKE